MVSAVKDRLAVTGLILGAVLVFLPLLLRPFGLPPDNDDLGLDIFTYYGFAGAGWEAVVRYGGLPLRSPWHGGGYPIYANPDDMTFTPAMLLVLFTQRLK